MRVPNPVRGLTLAVLLSLLLSGCTTSPPASADEITVKTNMGCFVIGLFSDDAPKTVENILTYVDEGFYDGTIFHRIVPGFVVQGGGFTPDGTQKTTNDPVELEAGIPNVRGTVAMARTSDPDSGTSQFYVNLVDNAALDPGGQGAGTPGYAVWGEVTVGMDVVDAIAQVPTGTGPTGMQSWPQQDAIIETVVRGADCAQAPPPEPTWGVEAGLIHDTDSDGVWTVNVSAETDYVPLYILNTGNQADTFTVTIMGPAHWDVVMDPVEVALAEDGSKSRGDRGYEYGYADYGVISLTYDESAGEATSDDRVTITIQSDGDEDTSTELVLAPVLSAGYPEPISQLGDIVTIGYRGYFDDGEVFDPGNRPLEDMEVGGAGLVTGFSFGMLGLAQDEELKIRFPPELGYGNDSPEGSRFAQFNNEWLNFDLDMQELPGQ